LGLMAKNKARQKIFVAFTAIVTMVSLAGLTGVFTGTPQPQNTGGDQTQNPIQHNIPCLTSEEFHLHSHLTILADGNKINVPNGIGVESGCTREIHTHDEEGIIHVESDTDKGYTFTDFLNVWGIQLEQPGYIARLTVNGEFNNNDTNFRLEDGQEILMEYITPPFEEIDPGSGEENPEITP